MLDGTTLSGVLFNDSGINNIPMIFCPEFVYEIIHMQIRDVELFPSRKEDMLSTAIFTLNVLSTVLHMVSDHIIESGRRKSITTVLRYLHNSGIYARRPVASVQVSSDDIENPAYAAKGNIFFKPDKIMLL